MPELNTSVEKEVQITRIKSLMDQYGIDIEEIPGGQRIGQLVYSLSNSIFHARTIYEKLMDTLGEDKAYEWAEANISSDWRTEIGIMPPKRFKSMEVSMQISIIVPENFSREEMEEVALSCICGHSESKDISILFYKNAEGIRRDDIDLSDYANDPDDFNESDWDY